MTRRTIAATVAAALAVGLSACSAGVTTGQATSTSATASVATSSGTSSALPTVTVSPSPTGTPTPAAVTPTPAGAAATCPENVLGAVEVRHGTTGSQAFSVIKVVNGGQRACSLGSYPRPAFWSKTTYRLVKLPLRVLPGSTSGAQDPGPSRFLLPPGGTAWFSVGTHLPSGGKTHPLTYFTFYPTANTSSVGVLCGVNLATDSLNPVDATVTAFAPGPPPDA
jgi:hypothetical protein